MPDHCGDEEFDKNMKIEDPEFCRYLSLTDEQDRFCCLFKLNDADFFCGGLTEEQYWHIEDYIEVKKRQNATKYTEYFEIDCFATYAKTYLIGLIIALSLLF